MFNFLYNIEKYKFISKHSKASFLIINFIGYKVRTNISRGAGVKKIVNQWRLRHLGLA